MCVFSGRLRPHFLSVCNPNITLTETECGQLDSPVYLTEFHCLGQGELSPGERQHRLHDVRLSFVSGHASLSTYSMWFCVVYIQQRMDTRNFRLVKPLIQVCCALFAVYTSLSRVSDYKHHPEDVVSGALLGLVISSLTLQFLMRRKDKRETRATSMTETDLLQVTTASSRMMYAENTSTSP